MAPRFTVVFTVAVLVCSMPVSALALEPYSQDFEELIQADPSALANDGWYVFGNVFDPEGAYLYGYGPFPAPNDTLAFSRIAIGEGGDEQGAQQLIVYSDYQNVDHAVGNLIESNVFQEQTIGPENVGEAWIFEFQAKLGNLGGTSTAAAFIKTLDPNNNYALTNFFTEDMTSIPETWGEWALGIVIDSSLEDQILQFGFMNTATLYEGSGIVYDNVKFRLNTVDVPDEATIMGASLQQNYPNPFNPQTRIDFSLDRPGNVEIAVFDLAGRRIATLQQGEMGSGDHHVTWNGRTATGSPAPSGQYRYVLKTAGGQVARSMVLLK